MKEGAKGCFHLLKITGVVVGSMLALLVLVLVIKYSYEYHLGFDRQQWLATGKAGTCGPDNSRESMVEDVMTHYLAPGMTRAQVLALLGPAERDGIEMVVPDGISLPDSLRGEKGLMNTNGFNKWYQLNSQPDTLMRYCVGWDQIDPTSMRIQFGGDERVKKFWVGLH
jgi:hypothetical protein